MTGSARAAHADPGAAEIARRGYVAQAELWLARAAELEAENAALREDGRSVEELNEQVRLLEHLRTRLLLTCSSQRIALRALRGLLMSHLADRLVVLAVGILLGLALSEWWGP